MTLKSIIIAYQKILFIFVADIEFKILKDLKYL